EHTAMSSYLISRGMTNVSGFDIFLNGYVPSGASGLIPVNDLTRMVYHDRATARAAVFTAMMKLIAKPAQNRTSDDNLDVAWMAGHVQGLRIAAARNALNEYTRWEVAGYCRYTAPPGFKAYSPGAGCAGGLSSLLGIPPAIPPFKEYGLAEANAPPNTPAG